MREPHLRAAQARIEAAEAAVARARLDLERTAIVAPFDAQVLTRDANLGSQVAAGAPLAAAVARLTRAGVLEALSSPFVRTARAKGLAPSVVLVRHALRAGIVPVVTWLGPATAAVLTGSLVIERIFAIPGMGSFFVTSVMNRDYTLATGVLLLYFGLVAVLNAFVEVALHLLDPRVELES